MHQDQRIGLALGVLLIGACAALFFRNETRERAETPRLQHAQELDDRISERTTRPYLKGVEAVEAGDRVRIRSIADRKESELASDEDHGGSYLSSAEQAFGGKNSSGGGQPLSHLTESDSDVQELAPIPVPGDRSLGDRSLSTGKTETGKSNSSSKPGISGRTSGENPQKERTHLVQKGESLSSIAAKHLGNSNRFQDLFEANRDQLRDANDLRSGMVLKIPELASTSASKTAQTKAAGTTSVERSSVERSSGLEPTPRLDGNKHLGERPASAQLADIREESSAGIVAETQKGGLIPSTVNVPVLGEPTNEKIAETPKGSDEATPRKFVPSKKYAPSTRPSIPAAKSSD